MKAGVILLSLVMFSTTAHADTTHVYECTINGERVFSDHVCGDGAVERNVTVTSRMDSVKLSASPKPDRHSKRVRTSRRSNDGDERRLRCAKIQKSRDALTDRMRAGFSARQDEKLHDRLRKLDNEYYELRCSAVAK